MCAGTELAGVVTLDIEEAMLARCPPGRYLGQQSHEDEARRSHRLGKALCTMKARNWTVHGSGGSEFKRRGWMTFESAAWPKPNYCAQAPQTQFKKDVPQQVAVMFHEGVNALFYKVWKVASSAFPAYLKCAFGNGWKRVTNYEDSIPPTPGALAAMASREPVQRFLSAAIEVLQRSVFQQCGNRACTYEVDGWNDKVNKRLEAMTTFFEHLQNAANSRGVQPVDVEPFVQSLVSDVACNFQFYASEHFTSQSTFAAGTSKTHGPLVAVARLEDEDYGLRMLEGNVSKTAQACNLDHKNTYEEKAKQGLPTKDEMHAILRMHTELMQTLCLVYAQDFVCFDYDLPEACLGLY